MDYLYITQEKQLIDILPNIKNSLELAIDTETTGLDPYTSKLRLLQIGTKNTTFIIDCFCFKNLDSLKDIFYNEQILKILHNAKFDIKMLKVHYNLDFQNIFDTMLASQIISAGINETHNLKAVTERYLGIELDKTERKSDWSKELTKEQLEYAVKDVEVLIPLKEKLKEFLVKEKLVRVAILEFNCCLAVSDMELNGCFLDKEKWLLIVEKVEKEHHKLALEIEKELSKSSQQLSIFEDFSTININSSQQLLESLGNMGIHLKDTSEGTLSQNIDKHSVIDKILEYRGLQKALSSYGKNILEFINKKTGRIHAEFHQLGAGTGRFSCLNPNLQQIPATEEYRSCFRAEKGNKLITADYSQIELRILAEISKDKEFIRAFESGEDLHKMTASNMFGIHLDKVTKEMRSQAKTINFGLVYGRGAASLAEQIGTSVDEAKKLIEKYFEVYQGVKIWLDTAAKLAVKTAQTRTLSNRLKKYIFNSDDRREVSSIERQGKNSPIQGTSADITKQALFLINKTFKNTETKLINTVHDEIILETPEDNALEVAKILEEKMIEAGRIYLKTVPLVVDVHIENVWSK
ncbi:MAG: DNA polymerase [Candidatus Sericytochromatia bacterium]